MHRHELREQAHDAQRAGDRQTADEAGQGRGDDATEDEEQHHTDQRDGRDLGAPLVLADAAGQFTGQRVQAGQLDAAVVELLQVRFDGLVVLQDLVVGVALQGDAHEGLRQIAGLHLLDGRVRGVGRPQPADPAHDLVGMVLDKGVEFADDVTLPLRVVDLLPVGRGEDGHHVAGPVATEGLVGHHRCVDRLAAFVVEAALGDVIAETDPEDAATEAERDHDADDDVSISVHRSTPPGEHVSSLLDSLEVDGDP